MRRETGGVVNRGGRGARRRKKENCRGEVDEQGITNRGEEVDLREILRLGMREDEERRIGQRDMVDKDGRSRTERERDGRRKIGEAKHRRQTWRVGEEHRK